MFHAISGKAFQAVDLLVDHGFSVNTKNEKGHTPLMFAVENYSTPYLIDNILQFGADPCAKNSKDETVHDIVTRLVADGNNAARRYMGMFSKCH